MFPECLFSLKCLLDNSRCFFYSYFKCHFTSVHRRSWLSTFFSNFAIDVHMNSINILFIESVCLLAFSTPYERQILQSLYPPVMKCVCLSNDKTKLEFSLINSKFLITQKLRNLFRERFGVSPSPLERPLPNVILAYDAWETSPWCLKTFFCITTHVTKCFTRIQTWYIC